MWVRDVRVCALMDLYAKRGMNLTSVAETQSYYYYIKWRFKMRLTSPEFENNGHIPKKFTCQGNDINPALIIDDIPAETKSLASIKRSLYCIST